MSFRQSVKVQALIFLVTCLYSAYLAMTLPDRVPIHWDIHGRVDGWGSKWVNVLMGPGLVAMMLALTMVLPLISPKNKGMDRFGATYGKIMVLVSMLMAFIHVLVGQGSANAGFDLSRVMFAGMFVFFALLGNLFGKVRQNYFVGIRTPWTLADERVWDATHRQAGKVWFFGGLLGALLSLLGVPLGIGIAILLILAFWPILDSYLIYRKIVGARR